MTISDAQKKLAHDLQQPHEWGYRDVVDGRFIVDSRPFDAASVIETLRADASVIEAQAVEISVLREALAVSIEAANYLIDRLNTVGFGGTSVRDLDEAWERWNAVKDLAALIGEKS